MRQGSGRTAPFQLKGSSFSLMVLKLIDPDDESFFPSLRDKVQLAPNFFHNAPVILDFDPLPPSCQVDVAVFVRKLRELNLAPVGVVGGNGDLQQAAVLAGLTIVPTPPLGARAERKPETVAEVTAPPVPVPLVPEARPTLIIDEPVRSGRQIYAPRGDLVVLAPVSAGAELLADGNIHVYSSLRGRALAGMNGDVHARIFCSSLEAELLSIAGLYKVSDDIAPAVHKKHVHIFLDGEKMRIEPLA